MKIADVQISQLLKITAGVMAGDVGRVKQINPKKSTVAMQVNGPKIHWFKADRLEPYYG